MGFQPFSRLGISTFHNSSNRVHKGQNRPHTGAPCEQQKQQQKQPRQNRFLVQPEMVGHIHRGDFPAGMADHHKGPVSRGEELVLRQRAVETVDGGALCALKLPCQNPHLTPLLPAAHQPGVHDVAFIRGQHQRVHPVGVFVGQGALKPRGQRQQHRQQAKPKQYRPKGFACFPFLQHVPFLSIRTIQGAYLRPLYRFGESIT